MVAISDPGPGRADREHGKTEKMGAALDREVSSAKQEAKRTGEAIRGAAGEAASAVGRKLGDKAEEGKLALADGLDDFTAAIRKASDELGERNQSTAARLVRKAASGLEDVAHSVKGRSLQELTHSVADFARQRPVAFLVGAALAGVALGRFARTSSPRPEDEDGGQHGY
ncbi:MAG: hypothetical protein AB7F36_12615 [Reyranellaceae bacterium]